MAQGFAAEAIGVLDGTKTPAKISDGRVVGGHTRTYQATFDLSLATVKKATGDTNVCFRIPARQKPIIGWLLSSVTMGASATIAVGVSGTAAKFKAAAVHTTPNVPTFFMLSSAADDAVPTDYQDVLITIAAADLPATGILQVFMQTTGL